MFEVMLELRSGAEKLLKDISSISWTKARVIFCSTNDKTYMINTEEILTCIIRR